MNTTTRGVVTLLAAVVFFTGVAAAQGATGDAGGIQGLIALLERIIGFLNAFATTLGSPAG
jgi:hypothetical protein